MLQDPKTLAEALEAAAETSAGITFIDNDDAETFVSYADLRQRARMVLNHLRSHGVNPGAELLICTSSNQQLLDAFWACQLGGMTAVPIAVAHNQQGMAKLYNVFETLHDGFILSNHKAMEGYGSFTEKVGGPYPQRHSEMEKRYVSADEVDASSPPAERHAAHASDIALIQFSSGTTGAPKGVRLSHQNLLANMAGIIQASSLSNQDRFLSWMPLSHDMGLIGFHLVPLLLGGEQYLMPTNVFARRPLLWLNKATEHKISLLSSPNFGYQHYLKAFASKPHQALDLSHVRLIFNGAEPISVEVCDRFCEAMAPFGLNPRTMFTVYGLAEASLAVTFPEVGVGTKTLHVDRAALNPGDSIAVVGDQHAGGRVLVSVGKPVPGCDLRIALDNAGVADGMVGHIQIRGANVTSGYYGDAQVRSEDAWLDTGDLGFIQGDLYIVGRSKDAIMVNGACLHAADLEELLCLADITEAGRVACASAVDQLGEQLIVFVQHRGDVEAFVPMAAQVRQALNERVGLNPHRVVPVSNLPKTTSGKIQRQRLGSDYESGRYDDVLAELDAIEPELADTAEAGEYSEIERLLLDICQEKITGDVVGIDDDLFELGASSLALAEICEEINSSFPGELELSDFLEYTSVAALATHLQESNN